MCKIIRDFVSNFIEMSEWTNVIAMLSFLISFKNWYLAQKPEETCKQECLLCEPETPE